MGYSLAPGSRSAATIQVTSAASWLRRSRTSVPPYNYGLVVYVSHATYSLAPGSRSAATIADQHARWPLAWQAVFTVPSTKPPSPGCCARNS